MALDPQTAALLSQLVFMQDGVERDMGAFDVAAARAASQAMWQGLNGPDVGGCTITALNVPAAAGPVPARLYRPAAADATLALVVFLHGGGWALGDLDGYQTLVKALCGASGAAFLSVDYRLAPENKFPAGLEDGLAAVRWVWAEAAYLGVDPARVAVMGDSAGGNLAAVIAQQLRASADGRLAAQFLLYPMLDVASRHDVYPSRQRFGDGGYLISRRDIDVTTAWYLPDPALAHDPRVSPLLASDFDGLPPAVILTAGFDPLCDEAKAYADKLRAARVPVTFKCFENTVHAFLSFGDLAIARAGRAWLASQVKRLLATA
ncbi:MAG: alpha/beta hydrolase [Alphaproteobacteria bacterium]|nr:MAG: alpha/beta hydrolase [Alphaproteobacteria bacterium]